MILHLDECCFKGNKLVSLVLDDVNVVVMTNLESFGVLLLLLLFNEYSGDVWVDERRVLLESFRFKFDIVVVGVTASSCLLTGGVSKPFDEIRFLNKLTNTK